MKIFIETDRLILREIVEDDLYDMFELDSDPEVHSYLGNKPIETLHDAKTTIEYIRNQYANDGIGRWAVIEKSTNEFAGWSGLKFEREVRKDMHYYDLGYRLKKRFWGKGIATESSKEALKYGFEVLNLSAIYGGAHVDNAASNRVLQKVGLTHLETFIFDNAPHHWYGIRREEVEGRRL